jgi:hypothetical protein
MHPAHQYRAIAVRKEERLALPLSLDLRCAPQEGESSEHRVVCNSTSSLHFGSVGNGMRQEFDTREAAWAWLDKTAPSHAVH